MLLKGEMTNIICIGYRWAHEKKSKCLVWDNNKQCSKKLIEDFTKIIESADVVIAHNGDKFDLKHINTQRLLHKQPPISWPTSEDTVKMARKHFNFPANNLNYLGKVLASAEKDKMEMNDWVQIKEHKCEKALAKMVKYCKKDVDLLYNVWERIAPYCEPKASRSIIKNNHKDGCPSCGDNNKQKSGTRINKSGKYQMYKCMSCAHKWRHWKKV